MGTCALCHVNAKLCRSHVMPKFGYQPILKLPGGRLRNWGAPKRPVQDGLKDWLLCVNCEGLLGKAETHFHKDIFQPLYHVDEEARAFGYGNWLLRFTVSVSWRNLLIHMRQSKLQHASEEQVRLIDQALETWRKFLLSETRNVGQFQQHLLLGELQEVTLSTSPDVQPILSRYLGRSSDMTVVIHTDRTVFVYSMFPKVVIIGFINVREPERWEGTRVKVGTGLLPKKRTIPSYFQEFLLHRAQRGREHFDKALENQSGEGSNF